MSNELIWLIFLVLDFGLALLAIKAFGKSALYALVIVGIILCNIQVLKLVNLFGLTVTLGNIAYGSIFLATDLISECYGKKEASKAVLLGFFSLVAFTLFVQLTNLAIPSEFDTNSDLLAQLFKLSPRITLASITAYLISQYHDVWAFHWWKQKTNGKHLWLRNNMSTIISQLLDSVLFVFIAFYGVYEFNVVMSIFYTTLFFKWVIAILDTPIVYIGKYILKTKDKEIEHINDNNNFVFY